MEAGERREAPPLDPRRVTGTIGAAGGAVWRTAPDGGIEVALIHRARYDDWSLPKGKAEPGEQAIETAAREVEEETGIRPVLGPELSPVSYRDHRGRDKTVRYWAMSVAPGEQRPFEPNDEVDELWWCTPDEARARLSYLHDTGVIDELVAVLGRR